MNKNIIKLFAILMMCFMIVSVLVGCGETADNNDVVVKDGVDGADGKDGLTPFIKDGYWWIGETNTGVKAEGKDADSIRCDEHDYVRGYDDAGNEIYNNWVLSVHTQTTEGCTLWVCLDCEGAYLEWVNHVYDAVVTEPTCTTTGYTTYTCECGLSYVDNETEVLPHDYTDVVTAPTCTATGYTTHTCNDCGHVLVDTETPVVPHTWGDWEPSLWDDGVDLCDCLRDTIMVRFCTVCDTKDSETQVIPAKGHVYTTWEPTIDTTTTISPCEQVPLEVSHCDVCKHEACNMTRPVQGATAPGHKFGAWVIVTEPTATTEGLIKSECSECGTTHTSGVKTEVLPALNNTDYTYVNTPADCENAGKDVYTYNKYEGIVIELAIPAKGHNYTDSTELTNLVAPTLTTPGKVTVGCVDCDHTTEVEIPAVGSDEAKAYIVDQGNCLEPTDTYCMPIDVDGHQVFVTFEAEGNYEHDERPADDAELVELDGEDKIYLAYWCTKCEHWIIVDWRLAD